MPNRTQTAMKNLKMRQADFDATCAGNIKMKGFKRPGSQNSHKQPAAGSIAKRK